eukprot:CAMPEP_0177688732 /NCGR_PEP_ID=MMETSP0447-20121125/34806_1 /TAXON_ID=0 /ORGANISM="Stygamoeba regulata, Strain BSH-02190019" /LENGTH=568 /DNA_ID=CAMNT_0019199035 /DNA_START=34 /DNA_END=1740 /DNA_ORIENTATION=+
MCGILCGLGLQGDQFEIIMRILKLSKLLRHRGPDWSGHAIKSSPNGGFNVLAHERLAIVDLDNGEQPLKDKSGDVLVSVNGEIYNHTDLRGRFKSYPFLTKSDCEIIIPLYMENKANPAEWLNSLIGMFAFVLYDHTDGSYIAARDAIGIIPLYHGRGKDGSMWFASEMKALQEHCPTFATFPPGHFYSSKTGKIEPWYHPAWFDDVIPTTALDLGELRAALCSSVRRQLMSDVPFGVLLSGGLDSSLISSIASRLTKRMSSQSWWPRLHSFSIGLKGSPDLLHAQQVADFLGTVHHSWTFTVEQGIHALSDVIYHLETYDVTTIRASTPMFLMARRIKAMGVKMVLSGEGADEVFGGYLYFHKAPNKEEFHRETVRKVKDLHMFDCLRANKSTSAWGLEVRPPFLDTDFLKMAMDIDPAAKMIDKAGGRMEKYILRKAFDTPEEPYLPDSVLWRQKEQFSDGVGYKWIDGLKAHAEKIITDSEVENAEHAFPLNTPRTKEAYLYRRMFEQHFPSNYAASTVPHGPSVACSTAKAIEWDESFKNNADPSGRAVLGVHVCDSAVKDTEH